MIDKEMNTYLFVSTNFREIFVYIYTCIVYDYNIMLMKIS